MISEESITQISHLFCGDTEGYYLYKTGPKLVAFFNQYLGSNDIYKSGFPSRWVYVYNKIIDCINTNSVDTFFNIILGKSYLMREQGISEVKAAELSNKILDEFNQIVSRDFCKITHIRVIKDEFSFVVKEIAATMLRYVAWDVNRFSVQHMVRDLLLSDLDPMLKDIIKE